jgi:hypothetical protein
VPGRQLYMIQSLKLILTIAWNPSGFHVLDIFRKREKFNIGYDMSAILQPLVAWHQAEVTWPEPKLIAHVDDAKPHTVKVTLTFCEQNSLKMAFIPSCSLDLVSSNLFLFGNINKLLARQSFAGLDELLEALLEI